FIQYQKINSSDGVNYTDFASDLYPPGATTPAMGQLVVPIDLQGGTSTTVKGQVKAVAIDPTDKNFWKERKPELKNQSLQTDSTDDATNTLTIDSSSISVVDKTGATISLTDYPNEQTSQGDIASWMKNDSDASIVAKQVIIRAKAKYQRFYYDNGAWKE